MTTKHLLPIDVQWMIQLRCQAQKWNFECRKGQRLQLKGTIRLMLLIKYQAPLSQAVKVDRMIPFVPEEPGFKGKKSRQLSEI